jgi:hypothetical protein
LRRNRILIFQQNARQILYSMQTDENNNMEALRQNIETLRMMEETNRLRRDVPTAASNQIEGVMDMPMFDLNSRQFTIGQWVDAKDTIEQWLEA